jgi:omega-6 fatty acid desaturase (delta-12 desaturase)
VVPANRTDARNAPWRDAVTKHQEPVLRSSLWQLVNSLVPYLALCGLMLWTLNISLLLTLALAPLAAGFMVRLFIIFHDCGHGSFFASRRANHFWGFVTGVLTFTPYHLWRHKHALHHATAGHLDKRGTGDVWTMTVQEYLESSRWKRVAYRLARNPFVLFVIAPLFLFLIEQRFPSKARDRRQRLGVHATNAALALIVVVMGLTVGLEAYLLIQLPVLMIAAAAGVWLFYVQHQFEGVYWERGEDWDFVSAALKGSSFYKLPKLLQWFSGSIGFHHIHHLSPGIPNYRLQKCHEEHPMFQAVKPITLWSSLRSFSFRLWDERRRKLVGYSRLRAIRRERQLAAR